MLTTNILVLMISSFCQIGNPNLSEEYKIHCMEVIANCAVELNGVIKKKKVESCMKEFDPNVIKKEWL